MALGSWQGLYNTMIDALMDEQREQELLLLMAICRHVDPLGFCYPGRARLMARRRISQPVYERRLAFLVERKLVRVEESYDYRRRQTQFDFQVSPRALYVREEFQEYCERVFDGIEDRNLRLEKWLLENHFSTNDSQPESEPDVSPESLTRHSQPAKATRIRTSGDAEKQTGAQASTMRNAKTEQPQAGRQRRKAQNRKNDPQAGGPPPAAVEEFQRLLSPTVDNQVIVDAIRLTVSTTEHQAREAVATYPRAHIVFWLQKTAERRKKGTLSKPGGWFFKNLREQTPFPEDQWPDWAREQKAVKDQEQTTDDAWF